MYRLSQAHTYRLLHRARRGSASRTRPPNQPPRRSHVAPESRAGPLHPTPIHTFIHLPTYSVHIQVYGPMNPVVALGASRSVLAMWGVNHGGYVVWALLPGNIRTSVLAVLLPFLARFLVGCTAGYVYLPRSRIIKSNICGLEVFSGPFLSMRALVGARLRGFVLQLASKRRRA